MTFAISQAIHACQDLPLESPSLRVGTALVDAVIAIALMTLGTLSLLHMLQIPPIAGYTFLGVGGAMLVADVISLAILLCPRREVFPDQEILEDRPETLFTGLDRWVNAKEDEKANRETAKEAILECYNLKETKLDLNHQGLSSLPSCLGELVHLEELYVCDNHLETLPDSIGNLVNLETLHIPYNQIEFLPDPIWNLGKLKFLNGRHNQLKTLPTAMNLPNLKRLDVRENQLADTQLSADCILGLTCEVLTEGHPS